MDTQDDAKRLSEEELRQVSGGAGLPPDPNKALPPCPKCGSRDTHYTDSWVDSNNLLHLMMKCNQCGNTWEAVYH